MGRVAERASTLEQSVALVTGGSSGIGRAIAKRLAASGAAVVVADVRRSPREHGFDDDNHSSTGDLIASTGGNAVFVETDVTKGRDMNHAVKTAVSTFGGLDIMVNNAGIWHGHKTILEETEAEYESTMAANIKGVWHGCKAAIAHMMASGSGGSIVNIASIAGMSGLAGEPAYSASKGAVIALTRQLAVDFAKNRIRVNAVSPGFVETALSRRAIGDNAEHDRTPWPRLGATSDVASAVLFLASRDAEWITGTNLVVDGGYVAR